MKNLSKTLAAWVVALTVAVAWADVAVADGYKGAPFSAEAWVGPEGTLVLGYKLYVGAEGYRLEAIKPVEGPDIIIAQFAARQSIYIDLNTGSVNFLPIGENDWGRFHGIACADFEFRKRLGAEKLGGRDSEVWQCIGSTRYAQDTKIWWDPALRYQVRSDEQGYVTELRNIVPGEPEPALFDVPAARN